MAETTIDPGRLADLLVESRIAVLAIDTDGVVTEWSLAAEALFGWTSADIVGQPVALVWPDDAKATDVRTYHAVMRGEHPHFQAWRRRRDGSHFLAEISTSPIFEAGERTGTLALCRDITAAAAGAADLHRLLGASSLAIIGIDERQNIRSWGGAAEELHGWTAEEMIGQPITTLWADTDGVDPHRNAMVSTDQGESTFFRAWRRRKDGSRFLAELTVSPTTAAADGWVGSVSVSRDVTHEHAVTERLRTSERRFAAAFGGAALPLVICRLDGHILEANTAYRALAMEVGSDETPERFQDLVETADRPRIEAALESLNVERRDVDTIEVETADGNQTLSISIAPVDEGPDAPPLALVQLIDVTDHRRLQAELSELATIDPLTRTFRRSQVGPVLDSIPAGTDLAVLFVDLDNFKDVNDTFGHHVGDMVLQTTARRLAAGLDPRGDVVRFGGDEFILVCQGIVDPAAATALSDALRIAVAEPIAVDDVDVHITASIGVSWVTAGPGLRPDDLVRAADAAMYAAKGAGRNRTAIAPLP